MMLPILTVMLMSAGFVRRMVPFFVITTMLSGV